MRIKEFQAGVGTLSIEVDKKKKKMVTERKISVLVSEARIANLETLTRENLFKVTLFSS